MLRGEEFGELRAEDSEGRHAEERGEVARAGVVADETVGGGEFVEQTIEIAEGVIKNDDIPAGLAQLGGERVEAIARPFADRARGARVEHDAAARAREG